MSEIQKSFTRDEAERLTERIRLTATTYMEAKERLVGLIQEAREGGAHKVLDFPSWTAYAEAVCSDTPLMQLTRDQRQELTSELADLGMSTRAIAPIVGADQKTVSNDLRSREEISSPDAEPRQITGRDGKTYTQSAEPPRRKSRPIPEQFGEACIDLTRLLDRFDRITESENYPRNKTAVAEVHRSDLERAVDRITSIIETL